MKKTRKKSAMQILLLLVIMHFASETRSQCTFSFTGTTCVGSIIQFNAPTGFSSFNWDFNGEGTSTTNAGTFSFKSSGTKTIKFSGIGPDGKPCSSQITVKINDNPQPKITLISPAKQCFKNNLFCFKDETTHPQGTGYKSIVWILDGLKEFTSTPPQTRCMKIDDPRGGKFDLDATYTDLNGCIGHLTLPTAVEVSEKIGADFSPDKSIEGCDQKIVAFRNLSRISKANAKSSKWFIKNGKDSWTFETDCYKGFDKIFNKPGSYSIMLVVEDYNGCTDTAIKNRLIRIIDTRVEITADKDSTCFNEPEIEFEATRYPASMTGFRWDFGDPPSGRENTNSNSLKIKHKFTDLGPYKITFNYQYVCDKQSFNKTDEYIVLIIGPKSRIEKPGFRIKEHQTFQCIKPKMDTVFFTVNNSEFYHNDKNQSNDNSIGIDSTVRIESKPTTVIERYDTMKDCDGKAISIKTVYVDIKTRYVSYKVKHLFDANNLSLPNAPKPGPDKRQFYDSNVVRIWDFGDNYAVKCTTDTKHNWNVNTNCRYSKDSLPWHYYQSWDDIMMTDYKFAPVDDAIFIDSIKLCKRLNIFPDSFFYIIKYPILSIPNDAASISLSNTAPYSSFERKNYLKENTVKGRGQREIEDYCEITVPAGSTIKIANEIGQTFTYYTQTITGPKVVQLKRKQVVLLPTETDEFTYNFYTYEKTDTIPWSFYKLYQAKGENPQIIEDSFKRVPPGKLNFDYKINYHRFRELWYARIPQCYNAVLSHRDTVHPLKCYSEDVKQLALMHTNAGGVGSGLLKQSIECLGNLNQQYGVTFILSDLKPGCTFSDVQINYDSFCDPDNFQPMLQLSGGKRPPGPKMKDAWGNYIDGGNSPNRFSKQYSAAEVCSPSQCVTVGIIVGNGADKAGRKPLCADTQWYSKFACFPLLDPEFEILKPVEPKNGFRKICKWDSVSVIIKTNNFTNTRDLKNLRWDFSTGNAGTDYSNLHRQTIDEYYFHYQKLNTVKGKKLDSKKLYHYIVQTKTTENPFKVPGTNTWKNGMPKSIGNPDTIVTAAIGKWDTFADVSLVWDNIKMRLEALGFDPFAMDGKTISKMIWNNVGIIGQPSSGAKGCIDTNGFGRNIKFSITADPNDVTILNFRDTCILPMDSVFDKLTGKWVHAYSWRAPWSGFYTVSLSMTDKKGNCDAFSAKSVIVGFGMKVEYNDSIFCRNSGGSVYVKPDYQYFNTDPINNGTWDNYDYWRDQARVQCVLNGGKHCERITRWDWSKADDDSLNPATKFGGAPYGGTGVGNPYVLLGGGAGMYYLNDSGVYTWRNIAGDSSGCMDTIERRLFISRLDVKFGFKPATTDCKPVLEFFDSTVLHDPCKWALPNMNNGQGCDFITEWEVTWGDNSRSNYYKRNNRNEAGIPFRLGHNYKKYGWYKVSFVVSTNQGCTDSFSRWIHFPGPKPKFEFTNKAGNIARICINETVDFSNLTDFDSLSKNPKWLWDFGDGKFTSLGSKSLSHKYTKAGTYKVRMELEDSVIMPPDLYTVCRAIYPDTAAGDAEILVIVSPMDSVKGLLKYPVICAGDLQAFVDRSDTAFKSYKWQITDPDGQSIDYFTNQDTLWKTFNKVGNYKARLTPNYNPSKPKPWCPMPDDSLNFVVEDIKADFNVAASSKQPDFVFNRITSNGVEYQWGFVHSNDITLNNGVFIKQLNTLNNPVQWHYGDSGLFWVCLVAKSKNGCLDTLCKPVRNDFFSDLRVSNVFTPEQIDGKNDLWQVYIQGQNFYHLAITNRYGARVFETKNGTIHWNGNVGNTGAKCPEGMYYYEIQYRMSEWKDQKIKTIKGGVYLIR